jgi:hypothetical protein
MIRRILVLAFCCSLFAAAAWAQQVGSFTSSGPITIPSSALGGNAATYPTSPACTNAACVTVGGMTGAVLNVTLTFNNWNNTSTVASAASLGVLLQSPAAGSNGASAFEVMGNACKSTGNQTFTMSDTGSAFANPGVEPCFGLGGGGTLKASADHYAQFVLDPFSSPGPGTTYQRAEPDSNPIIGGNSSANTSNGHGTFAYVFNGMTNPNGIWRLYVWSAGDVGNGAPSGAIGSWTLTITTAGSGTSTSTTITSHAPSPSFTTVSPVTLTAQVTPSTGTVNVGNVLFHDDGVAGNNNSGAADLGTAAVNSNGLATLSNVQFTTEGAHRIMATYQGAGSFAASAPSPAVTHEVIQTSTAQAGAPNGTVGFCNTGGITIPAPGSTSAIGAANPYPSSIVVSGQSGIIQGLRVYLNGITSNNPAFSGFLLAGPNGKTLDFASFTGGSSTLSGINVIFDDTAASLALPDTVPYASNASYKPTAAATLSGDFPFCTTATCNGIIVSEPAPGSIERAAPQGNPARTLNQQFAGANPNGTWKLFGYMDGTFTESLTGWCINFTLGNGTATTTSVTSNPNPSLTNNAVTFTATVTGGANPINEGTVTFTDSVSGGNLGTVAVSSGQAVLGSITNLAEGTHVIIAAYNGTANFGYSSGSVSQRVNNPTVQTGTKYCNQASAINIPATGFIIGASSPYPSNVIISQLPGTINSVEIDLNGYTLNDPNILQSLLVGPCQSVGCSIDFFSHPPEGSASGPINLAFADGFASSIPNSAFALAGGSYKPSSFTVGNTYSSPAPAGPYNYAAPADGTTLSGIFANGNANGTWSYYPYITTGSANAGSITSWCVNLTMNKPTLAVSKTHTGPGAGNAFVAGQTGAYTIGVTNNGPGSTAGATLTLTDNLPPGFTQSNINGGPDWTCATSTSTVVTCTSTAAKAASQSFSNIVITVTPDTSTGSNATNTATAAGFGMTTGSGSDTASILHPPFVTTNPVNVTVNAGANATFTAAAGGSPAPTVQWQVSTGGGPFSDIGGATSTTLTLNAVTAAMNGNQYQAVFTNSAGTAASTAATLTVNSGPSVTTNPVSQSVPAGNTATFTAAASGNPTPTVQWQISTDGGATFNNIAGATSTTLSFTALVAQNGNQYRAVFTNLVGSATTMVATLTVTAGPMITANPVSVTVNAGANATFTAAASGLPAPTVQWLVSSGGGPFSNIPGATSTTLTLNAVTAAMNGNQYQAMFTNSIGSATTTAATLTVNFGPSVTTNPVSHSVAAGSNATFTAAANGNPAPTVQWQISTDGGATFNNIAGGTSTTLSFTALLAQNGNQYRAVFTNLVGSATTTAATLTVTPTSIPTVTSFRVLWGAQSYQMIGSIRNRLPWTITGIQVTFSAPMVSGNLNSLGGVTPTLLSGLGTNTLTWTINPVSLGAFTVTLAGSGPNALQDGMGTTLGNGAGASQLLRILYGDYNDDGVVNAADTTSVLNLIRGAAYDLFADMNGDGAVTVADYQIVRAQIGNTLP